MPTAEELIVAIQSEGVNETTDKLNEVEKSMEETADSAGQSAEELEGFSQKFQGAMKAAIAGLAVGVAGLLSQIPVLGEAFSGLSAIATALILKIDGDLRPAISGLTKDLFGTAKQVNESEGTFQALKTAVDGVNQAFDNLAINTVQTQIQKLTGITIPKNWLDLGWDIITLDTRQAVQGIIKTVRQLPQDIGTLLGSMDPVAKKQFNKFLATVSSFIASFKSGVRSGIKKVRKEFTQFASGINNWASNLASDAKEWGKDLIEKFISGVQSVLGKLRNWLSDLRDVGAEVGINVPNLGGFGGGGGSGGGGGGGRPRFGGSGGGGTLTVDGRQLTESTGRYRSDPGRRRGL